MPDRIKKERSRLLRTLAEEIAREKNVSWKGRTVPVMITESIRPGSSMGRTREYRGASWRGTSARERSFPSASWRTARTILQGSRHDRWRHTCDSDFWHEQCIRSFHRRGIGNAGHHASFV